MAQLTATFSNVLNNQNYYARIYPVNPQGSMQSELYGQVTINAIIPASFPAEPSSYSLIDTYTSSTTFTAPEDGWYQVELFGRSGEGGWSHINCGDGDDNWTITGYTALSDWITGAVAGGGAGGGGAYCCSTDIKLNKGDKIAVTLSNLSGTDSKSYVEITSSAGETYSDMVCMSGGDGSDGYAPNNSAVGLTGGNGGAGGVASGGNYMNKNGGAGATGAIDSAFRLDKEDILAPANGGVAGYTGGNVGGQGVGAKNIWFTDFSTPQYALTSNYTNYNSKKGFCKIYRGNTNVTSGGNDSSSVPSAVTNFTLSGNKFNVALSWTNPTEDSYYKTIIVQKSGSAPTNLTDGTQVYNGTGTSYSITNLSPSTTYYYAAFAVNSNNEYATGFPTKSYTTPSAFPAEPSNYSLINLYTSSQRFTAPEDGYYKIEVFGASGSGGACYGKMNGLVEVTYTIASGGGGGGGGYACSQKVKLNAGDTIVLVIGYVGGATSATINGTAGESYSVLNVTSGGNGKAGSSSAKGTGGSGGVGSGGNYLNKTGSSGSSGTYVASVEYSNQTANGGSGGSAGYTGGRTGGKGANITCRPNDSESSSFTKGSAGSGSRGFVKIYRGNTNVVS